MFTVELYAKIRLAVMVDRLSRREAAKRDEEDDLPAPVSAGVALMRKAPSFPRSWAPSFLYRGITTFPSTAVRSRH